MSGKEFAPLPREEPAAAVDGAELAPPPTLPMVQVAARLVFRTAVISWFVLPLVYLWLLLTLPAQLAPGAPSHKAALPPPPPKVDESRLSCDSLRAKRKDGWAPHPRRPSLCVDALLGGSGSAECGDAKVYIASSKMCTKAGARLCSASEVAAGAAEQAFPRHCPPLPTVWSSGTCGVGGSNYLVFLASGRPATLGASVNRSFASGDASCDMSSGRHHMVCCGDVRRPLRLMSPPNGTRRALRHVRRGGPERE